MVISASTQILVSVCVLLVTFQSVHSEEFNSPRVKSSQNTLKTFLRATGAGGAVGSPSRAFLASNTRASHDERCETSPCVITNGLTCDQNTHKCRCLHKFDFSGLEIDGRTIRLAWNATTGRCMAPPNTLCAYEPVEMLDEDDNAHLVPINCGNDLKCTKIEDIKIMKVGYCQLGTEGEKDDDDDSGAGTVHAGVVTLMLAVLAKAFL